MVDLSQARALGLKLYQGAPCPHCHKRQRYTSSRTCTFCTHSHYDRARATAAKAAWRARRRMAQSPMVAIYLAAMAGQPERSAHAAAASTIDDRPAGAGR